MKDDIETINSNTSVYQSLPKEDEIDLFKESGHSFCCDTDQMLA